jgi:hypothetical protein
MNKSHATILLLGGVIGISMCDVLVCCEWVLTFGGKSTVACSSLLGKNKL